ncbi:DUF3800 domain-containing protein [Planctomycetales bacterium ZRK34]|nr:DUF3800 domain-containing protein [Planctomycetales bacterium ZRK34]
MGKRSQYIIYVDESGDHEMLSPSPEYPMFVLAFCIFRISDYVHQVAPALQEFKFDQFGHDMVVLHERDIRKQENDFKFLFDAASRKSFFADLRRLMQQVPLHLIAVAIRKDDLRKHHGELEHPYHIALEFGLNRVNEYLIASGQDDIQTYVIVEQRGKREDNELELEFRRICDEPLVHDKPLPFRLRFASKMTNSCGLQLADLVARPIGRHVLNPGQTNRAYEILEKKFVTEAPDGADGWGLWIYPRRDGDGEMTLFGPSK